MLSGGTSIFNDVNLLEYFTVQKSQSEMEEFNKMLEIAYLVKCNGKLIKLMACEKNLLEYVEVIDKITNLLFSKADNDSDSHICEDPLVLTAILRFLCLLRLDYYQNCKSWSEQSTTKVYHTLRDKLETILKSIYESDEYASKLGLSLYTHYHLMVMAISVPLFKPDDSNDSLCDFLTKVIEKSQIDPKSKTDHQIMILKGVFYCIRNMLRNDSMEETYSSLNPVT